MDGFAIRPSPVNQFLSTVVVDQELVKKSNHIASLTLQEKYTFALPFEEGAQYPLVDCSIQPHEFTVSSIGIGHERAKRLVSTRNKYLWFALPCLAFAVALNAFGQPIEALAPLSFFFGSLGSIIVLQMKISNVT